MTTSAVDELISAVEHAALVGELVEFVLSWEERGIPHAAHQAHALRVVNGRIAEDVAFRGGRWPASLLAAMGASAQAAQRERAHVAG